MNAFQAAQWLRVRKPSSAPRLRLVCASYAGGGAQVFHSWPDALPKDIEVCAIQLPGRQDRLGETPLKRVAEITPRLVDALAGIPPAPTVLFGHSFGSLVAFDLARQMQANGTPFLSLIVGARDAPHLPPRESSIYDLPKPAFFAAIHRRYGTPMALMEEAELMELALPSLRADMEALETYVPTPGALLSVPITVLRGSRDSVPLERAAAWGELTRLQCNVHEVDAGHFSSTHSALPGPRAREGSDRIAARCMNEALGGVGRSSQVFIYRTHPNAKAPAPSPGHHPRPALEMAMKRAVRGLASNATLDDCRAMATLRRYRMSCTLRAFFLPSLALRVSLSIEFCSHPSSWCRR